MFIGASIPILHKTETSVFSARQMKHLFREIMLGFQRRLPVQLYLLLSAIAFLNSFGGLNKRKIYPFHSFLCGRYQIGLIHRTGNIILEIKSK